MLLRNAPGAEEPENGLLLREIKCPVLFAMERAGFRWKSRRSNASTAGEQAKTIALVPA